MGQAGAEIVGCDNSGKTIFFKDLSWAKKMATTLGVEQSLPNKHPLISEFRRKMIANLNNGCANNPELAARKALWQLGLIGKSELYPRPKSPKKYPLDKRAYKYNSRRSNRRARHTAARKEAKVPTPASRH
jgi:hypothetical protein